MKVKSMSSGCNNASFGLYLNRSQRRMLNKMFVMLTDFKNGFITLCNSKIDEYAKIDAKFKDALDVIRDNSYGVALYNNEKSEEVKMACKYLYTIYKEKIFDFNAWKSEYLKSSDDMYRVYLPDSTRDMGLRDVISGYEIMFKGNGKSVGLKKYDQLYSIYSKPERAKDKETGKISLKQKSTRQDWLGIEYIDGKYYLSMWDCRPHAIQHILSVYDSDNKKFTLKSCPKHKRICIKLHINKKDKLQLQLLDESIYRGNLKIARIFKGSGWRYYLQVNFERNSPVVDGMRHVKGKVAVNLQTQTVAFCRMDGEQGILELTPSTPRIVDEIQKNSQFMDRSKRIMNPNLFNENGTIRYRKEEMRELGLEWKYSRHYRDASRKNKMLYATLTRNRKLNNMTTAKYLLGLGNDFILDNNSFRSWGVKKCHMSEKSKERIDSTARVKDYTKLIHDRAPGMIDARIKSVCEQRDDYNYDRVKYFSTSMYNHFTGKYDIFTKLNNRIIAFTKDEVLEDMGKYVVEYFNTFTYIKDADGNAYVVQRDIYGASKMLFLYKTKEEKIDAEGKKYMLDVFKFDDVGYSKWFKEVFYPKHLEYIKYLIGVYNLGAKLDGTILGVVSKYEKVVKNNKNMYKKSS